MNLKVHKGGAKLNTAKMRALLVLENEFITNLLAINDVPDSIHDDTLDEQFLLKSKKPSGKKNATAAAAATSRATSADALQERLETMKNKIGSKKSKPSDKTIKKRQLKKLKKDKELKKKIVGVAKSLKNEKSKEAKSLALEVKREQDEEDSKADVKPVMYNEDGKMVFSKFEFAAQASKAKKGKKDKVIKNPKQILHNIKKQKREISELIEQGDVAKATEIKTDLAWKKAFDKTEGKAVKDDTQLLHKTIKRKKVLKKKSKVDWKNRTEKVTKDMATKQKKRNDNIKKKQEEKKKNKLKKLSKRGRIIPGY